jgi:hypothetical protein
MPPAAALLAAPSCKEPCARKRQREEEMMGETTSLAQRLAARRLTRK